MSVFATVLAIGSVASAQTASATIFTLLDHPNGGLADEAPYGIRVQSLNGNPAALFSVSTTPGASVQLDWDDTFTADNASAMAVITGTVVRNDDGTPYANTTWTVSYTLTELTPSPDNGFRASAGVGTLVCDDCPDGFALAKELELSGKAKKDSNPPEVFTFADDGHRLPGDSDSWVARGWILPVNSETGEAGTKGSTPNDWLVRAEIAGPPAPPNEVPEPSALLLFGFGLAGLASVLRRRRTAA